MSSTSRKSSARPRPMNVDEASLRMGRRKIRWVSLLMVRFGSRERSYYGPANFYRWSQKAKEKYLKSRWPKATGCCNGVPFSMGGARCVYL